jgi:hypothetical protein
MKKDSDKDSPEESGEVAREQKGQDKEDTRGWSPWPSYRSNRHGPTAGVETIATRKLKKRHVHENNPRTRDPQHDKTVASALPRLFEMNRLAPRCRLGRKPNGGPRRGALVRAHETQEDRASAVPSTLGGRRPAVVRLFGPSPGPTSLLFGT